MGGAWTIRDFSIEPYPVAFLLSFAAGLGFVSLLLRRRGQTLNIIRCSLALLLVMTLYGARLYGVVASGFQKNLLTSGTSSLGGAMGLLLAVFLMGKICPGVRKDLWLACCMALPLMYGIAKTGCFLAGCCYGIPYGGPLAVSYQNSRIQIGPVFPVQLLESAVFLLIFVVGLRLYRGKNSGGTASWMMLLCAAAKFGLEFLRQEHVGRLITGNQWVCGAFFLAAVISLLREGKFKVRKTSFFV